MFDINTVNRRFFEIKINELSLQVEPPKIKTLKKIMHLTKSRDEDAMDELAEAIRLILNKNKSTYVVSIDIIDELDIDEMNEILTKYFEWLTGEKNSPN